MPRLLVPFTPWQNCGGVLTFQGDRPDQAIFWELVSFDPEFPEVEYPSQGYLKYSTTKTDKASLSVNVYHAPTVEGQKLIYNTGRKYNTGLKWNGDPALAGFNDRIKVKCDA